MFALCAASACLAVLHSPASVATRPESHGKPTALLFISHDCPICNAYSPEIGRLERRFGSKVKFVLVYCDLRLSPAEARSHAKEFSISNAEIRMDPQAKLSAECKATVTPQAVVFDSAGVPVYSGRIDDRYRALGQQRPAATTHDLAKALEDVLAHKKPKPAAGPPVGCFIVFPNSK